MAATITALPTPPTRQSPSTFSDRSDAFLAALPAFQSEANILAADAETNASTASAASILATTKASEAEISAQAAVSAANVSKWISGTTYTEGAAVWSTVDYQTYRRKTNGAGTTDPSSDSTNWELLGLPNVITEKTLDSCTIVNGYTEEVFTITDGASIDLDPNNGSIQTWTLGASRTATESFATGQSIILGIGDGTGYSLTWPTITWTKVGGEGVAPTLATTGMTWVVLWKVGTTLYGSHLGDA